VISSRTTAWKAGKRGRTSPPSEGTQVLGEGTTRVAVTGTGAGAAIRTGGGGGAGADEEPAARELAAGWREVAVRSGVPEEDPATDGGAFSLAVVGWT